MLPGSPQSSCDGEDNEVASSCCAADISRPEAEEAVCTGSDGDSDSSGAEWDACMAAAAIQSAQEEASIPAGVDSFEVNADDWSEMVVNEVFTQPPVHSPSAAAATDARQEEHPIGDEEARRIAVSMADQMGLSAASREAFLEGFRQSRSEDVEDVW